MQSPEARDEHVVDALLDGGALLEDPIRMAAVLDELRARRAEPRPELRMAVAERLAAPAATPRRAGARRGGSSPPAASPRSRSAPSGASRSCVIGRGQPGSVPTPSCAAAAPHVAADSRSTAARGELPAARPARPSAGTRRRSRRHSPLAPRARRPAACRTTRRGCACASRRTTRLSQVAQRAISLTRGFGGYVTRSDVNVQGAQQRHGRRRRAHPDRARAGCDRALLEPRRDLGQHVAVADLQAGYDAAARRVESLRHSLALIEVRLADPKVTPEQRVALLAQRERARHALAGATQTTTDLSARGAYARIDLAFSTGAKPRGRRPRTRDSRSRTALHRVGGILETGAIGALYAVLLGGPVLRACSRSRCSAGAMRRRRARARAARPRVRAIAERTARG